MVRGFGGGFAIEFDDALAARVAMTPAFHAGRRHLQPFHGVKAPGVLHAVLRLVFS